MKNAFAQALQASQHLTLCDTCPINTIHKLCNHLEGIISCLFSFSLSGKQRYLTFLSSLKITQYNKNFICFP